MLIRNFNTYLVTKLQQTLILAGIIIFITGLVMFIVIQPIIASSTQISNTVYNERPINAMWGDKITVNNDSEASKLVSFTVNFPSKILDKYDLQLAIVDPTIEKNKYVRLFYSSNKIPNTMTLPDFFAQNGVYTFYHKSILSMQNVTLFQTILSGNVKALQYHGYDDAREIEINGYLGTIYSQKYVEFEGSQIHYPSQLEFFVGDSDITIEAYLQDSVLEDIAKSISQ
jgi:hypothetical protein